ncbi:MAG: glycerophosphodiester phosphodiesterase [Actinobacteria bacterium]|nr:glycerophosphodiester phosphodiesterase [Actinomycetota bacterium]
MLTPHRCGGVSRAPVHRSGGGMGHACPVTRLPSKRSPIGFAHRGARSLAQDNTLDSFRLALRLGATGIESDAWITADGRAVLDHDGLVRGRLRRRPISEVARGDLPAHIPELADLLVEVDPAIEISLDVKDPAAAAEIVACARDAGLEHRLWLCHPDRDLVASWRELSPTVHLVESTRVARMHGSFEGHVARSAAMGIEVINLHHSEWTGGLIALVHRFDMLAFAWDLQHERLLDSLLDSGIDAVFSDHVDRMVDALGRL